MKIFKKIMFVFSKEQKINALCLLIMILVGTFLELLGVSLILPFVNVIISPESIENNSIYLAIYNMLRLDNQRQFLLIILISLIIVYMLKNAYLLFMYNSQFKFTYNNQAELASRLMKCYMDQPYLFHLSKNSAELLRNISMDVSMFFAGVLSTLQLITEIFVCIALFVFLLATDLSITIGVACFMFIFLICFYGFFRKKFQYLGEQNRIAGMNMTKWLQQSFGGIKETKVLGRESYFLKNFKNSYSEYVNSLKKNQIMSIAPRPLMETMCVCGLLIVVAIKLIQGANTETFIPTLSVFAVAAFRVLPSINRITGSMGSIMFNKTSVDALYKDIYEANELNEIRKVNDCSTEFGFVNELLITDLSFKYPNTEKYIFKNINLSIPKNKSVAFIGASGAGKTTLVDIILGILEPENGSIYCDGFDVFKNIFWWHRKLGYIPQTIYLLDDTIRNNILFGVHENQIDENRVSQVIEESQLKDFIDSLEKGIETQIGERGIRLSGGQRQRIGIARALYNNPAILVLDEATSALDNDTENAVMEAIDSLHGTRTLIIIAHRLTTIKNCDYIYEVGDGKVIKQ